MKILMVTNKVLTYALGFQNVIESFRQLGHTVIWAADFSKFVGPVDAIPCETRQINISSNPLKLRNLSAYRQLLRIIAEEKVDAVYCSTPMGGTLARLAAHKKKVQKVIYAAHGFLFFNGTPWLKKKIFELHEKWLAHWTDALITITEEDLQAAKNFKLRSGERPYFIHGAGVEVGKRIEVNRAEKRKELGLPDQAFVLVSAGSLNKNKNNQVVIKALAQLNDPNTHYLICGEGEEAKKLNKLTHKHGLIGQVHFLGYRVDIAEIMAVSDVLVMPSFREGIPRALLEAMDLGLPCVGSNTRGISELIGDEKYLCSPSQPNEFAAAFRLLRDDENLRLTLGRKNQQRTLPYSVSCVRNELTNIFGTVLQSQRKVNPNESKITT